MKPIKILIILLTQITFILTSTQLRAQSLSYSNAITSLSPAGYWPMHEAEPAAQGDIETNYGTLGVLGNGYYPDYQINSGAFIRQMPGPLVNGQDQSILFTEPADNSGTATNALLVPRTSPLTTLKPPFTVELWYMATNFPVPNWQGDLWSQMGDGGTRTQGIRVYYQNSPPGTLITVLTYAPSTGQINVPAPAVTNNVWHHLVVTCSATTNFTAWMDGVSVASGSEVGKYTPDNRTPFTLADGLGYARSWHGLEAEVAVYTNVISDIATHYYDATNTAGTPGQYVQDVLNDNPVLFLRLNSSPYTPPDVSTWPTVTNYGSVAVNGLYTPGTLPGAVGGPAYSGYPLGLISTNVAHLSGVSSFADVGYADSYNPTGPSTNFTVTAFFRGNPIDTNRVQSIVGHGTNSWELGLTSLGRLVFNSGTNSTAVVATGSGAGDLVSTTYANDGKWHQVVAVHNWTTNVLYVDGMANNTNVVSANNIGNSYDVIIGSDPCYTNNPVGLGRQFAGQICDVAFFTNALTVGQVQTLYNDSGIPVQITQQPVSAAFNEGVAFTNTVVVTGSQPSYQWFTNGVAIGGATNASLIFNPVMGANASTNYYVVITNEFSAVTSAVVSLTVVVYPQFVGEFPITYNSVLNTNYMTLYPGANPTFSVSAIGAIPLSYQWFTNGVLDSAATTNSLTLTNVQTAFITYCVLGNSHGSTNVAWSAQVVPNPTNSIGSLAAYPQLVMTLNPIAYWRLNDYLVEGENGNGDDGYIAYDYAGGNDAIYTNAYLQNTGYNPTEDPSDSSAEFGYGYAFNSDAGLVGTNIDFSVPAGSNAEFSVSCWANWNVTNVCSLVAKGYGNGGEELTLDCDDKGYVRFGMRTANGSYYSAEAPINEGNWYHVVGVCDEANTNLIVYVNGLLGKAAWIPLTNGLLADVGRNLIMGARSSSLANDQAGIYNNQLEGYLNDVAIFNYALTSNQVAQMFQAGAAYAMFNQEPPSTVQADYGGGTVVISAVVNDAKTYQWFNAGTGQPVTGQTNAALILSNLTANASYYLTAYNAYGSTNSTTVNVNVNQGVPQITAGTPQSPFYAIGGQIGTNFVAAYGTWPLAYQWQYSNSLGWVNVSAPGIIGSQSNILTIADPYPSEAGFYQVVVTNIDGVSTSSPAQLVVMGVPLTFNTNGANGSGLFWTLNPQNPSPVYSDDLLTLTYTNNPSEGTGVYFYQIPQYIGAFEASFTYEALYAGTQPMADGATFCIQNDPRGAGAYGNGGGNLAYNGNAPGTSGAVITPSVALELNIFPGNGVGGMGYSVNTNGGIGPTTSPGSVVLTNVPVDVTIYYANGQMAITFSNEVLGYTYSTNMSVNIPGTLGANMAYVGFTGAFGGDVATQTITNFTFVSVPSEAIALNGTNAVVSWPAYIPGYTLQQNSSVNSGNWINVTNPLNYVNGTNVVVTPSKGANEMFYRLMLVP